MAIALGWCCEYVANVLMLHTNWLKVGVSGMIGVLSATTPFAIHKESKRSRTVYKTKGKFASSCNVQFKMNVPSLPA